jgi:phenylacetate-CoA ligase
MFYNEKSETMSREELTQLQIERLQSTLNRVYRNVAFYRQAFDAHKVDIERVKSIETLRELPFTTRDDLRKSYPYDMFAVPLREVVRIHSTAGTTGRPIVMGYTRNDLRNWTECTARLLTAAGITANDVVQIMFHYNLFTGGFGFHQGAEQIGASVIPSSSTTSAEKQITIMKDFKTTALILTPSYAVSLATVLEELKVHPERLHLRVGLFGGEPWSDNLRSQLEERLHIQALDTYGISEVMGPGVAGECQERNGLHVNEDHFMVEVIDPATLEPVPAGGEGELVFTTVTKEGFPIIRYRTGDITSLVEAPCPCGRTFARVARVTGRTDDRIFFKGVSIFPSQVEEILLGGEGTSPHFQIILDREEGVDTIEIKVEVSELMPSLDEVRRLERLRGELVKRIETALDISAKITFAEPKSLGRTKGKPVVDKRPH